MLKKTVCIFAITALASLGAYEETELKLFSVEPDQEQCLFQDEDSQQLSGCPCKHRNKKNHLFAAGYKVLQTEPEEELNCLTSVPPEELLLHHGDDEEHLFAHHGDDDEHFLAHHGDDEEHYASQDIPEDSLFHHGDDEEHLASCGCGEPEEGELMA